MGSPEPDCAYLQIRLEAILNLHLFAFERRANLSLNSSQNTMLLDRRSDIRTLAVGILLEQLGGCC